MKKYLTFFSVFVSTVIFCQSEELSNPTYVSEPDLTRIVDISKPVFSIPASVGASAGAAVYTVPISVPSGVNGMTPQVAISYNSNGGHADLGYAWSLSATSEISLAPSNYALDGVKRGVSLSYYNYNKLALDGQRLVLKTGTLLAENSEYRTYVESHQKIENITTPDGWSAYLVTSKSGLKRYYGVSSSHRVDINDNGVIFPYKWLLEYAEDINGNRINYTYVKDASLNSYRVSKISYITFDGTTPLAEILFTYTSRTDYKSGFMDGATIGNNHLLKSIESTYNGQRFSKYDFQYTFRTGTTGNDISRLVQIDFESLNSTTVNSTLIDWHDASLQTLIDPDLKPTLKTLSTRTVTGWNVFIQNQVIDINGDGLDDILSLEYHKEDKGDCYVGLVNHEMSENIYTLYANIKDQSASGFTRVKVFGPITSEYKLENCEREGFAKFYLGDFNGDGLIDILFHKAESHEHPNSPNWFNNFPVDFYMNDATNPGSFNNEKTIDQDNHLYFSYVDNSTRSEAPNFYPYELTVADFDGDGISDISYIGSQYDATTPTGPTQNEAYAESCHFIFVNSDLTIQREMYDEEISFGDLGVQIPQVGDFNGDGKADLMFLDNLTSTIIKMNNNRNSWGVLSSGGFPNSYHYIEVGDFNGDGLSDLLTQAPNASDDFEVHYSNGQAFVFPPVDPGINYDLNFHHSNDAGGRPTYFDSIPFVFTADFDHDGRTDVLVYEEYEAGGNDLYRIYIHFNKITGWSHKEYLIPSYLVAESGIISGGHYLFHLASFYGNGSLSLFYNYEATDGTHESFNFEIRPDDKSKLVRQILDGYNRLTTFNYKRLTDPSVYTRTIKAYPNPTLMAAMPVVSEITQDDFEQTGTNGGTYLSHTIYTYHNLKYNSKGLGMLGFVRERAKDQISLLEHESVKGFISSSLVTTDHLFLPVQENTSLSTTSALIAKKTFSYQDTDLKTTFTNGKFIFNAPKTLEAYDIDYLKETSSKTSSVVYDNDGNITSSKNELFSNTTASGSALITTLNSASYTNAGSWLTNAPTQTVQLVTRSGKPQAKNEVTYAYNSKGNVSSKISQPNTSFSLNETFTYTSAGNIGFTTLTPNGMTARTTAYTYSADSRFVLTETNPLNWVKTYTYNDLEQTMASEVDENNLTTTYTYDDLNRLTRTDFSDGFNYEEVKYTWDLGNTESGALYQKQVSGSNMPTAQVWYNGKMQEFLSKTKNRDDVWVSSKTLFNSKNQVWKTSIPYIGSTPTAYSEFTYDAYGRVTSETLPTTATITTAYATNSVTVNHSGTGESSTKIFDASGSTLSSTDAGGTIAYEYDSRGNPLSISSPSGTTNMEYDQGYQIELDDPAMGLMQYEYNALGEITKQEDARGNVFTMTYDKLGRVLVKSGPDGNYTYTYDHFKGALSTVSSPYQTSASYAYDTKGRLQTEIENVDGRDYELAYDYDGTTGLLTSKTYPNDLSLKYTHDANGYLIKIEEQDNAQVVWEYAQTNALGQIREYSLGQTTVSRIYDPITGLPADYYNDQGWSYNYSFDNQSGNLNERTNNLHGISESFEYDNLNRLINQEGESGSTIGVTYAANGNILNKTDAGDYENEVNGRTSIVSDANNISDDSQSITYTPFNSIATIMEGDFDATFVYGADEQRKQMIVQENGQPTIFRTYLFGSEYEIDFKDDVLRNIIYVNTPTGQEAVFITEEGNHELHLLHTDYLGSILAVTDEHGSIIEEYSYDAWGNRREADTWQNTYHPGANYDYFDGLMYRGFTGHEHLDEFGLINMNGRVYDPLVGRMLSPDNFVQNAGFTQNFNRYSYAYGNPLKYTDPDGEWIHIAIGAVAGGVINLVSKSMNGQINGWQDGFVAFGIGAGAGALIAATGGAAAVAVGGSTTIAGAGGFIAGAVGGGVGSGVGTVFQSAANTMYFGDPFLSGTDLLQSIALGAVTGGVVNGTVARLKGFDFWRGSLNLRPTTIPSLPAKEMAINSASSQSTQQIRVSSGLTQPLPSVQSSQTISIQAARQTGVEFAAKGSANLLKAANAPSKGGLTAVGRALQKHGSRAGSIYPKATGNAASINAQGQSVLKGVLSNPNATTITRHHARFGNIMDIRVPGGQGARFSADGKTFLHFLE